MLRALQPEREAGHDTGVLQVGGQESSGLPSLWANPFENCQEAPAERRGSEESEAGDLYIHGKP